MRLRNPEGLYERVEHFPLDVRPYLDVPDIEEDAEVVPAPLTQPLVEVFVCRLQGFGVQLIQLFRLRTQLFWGVSLFARVVAELDEFRAEHALGLELEAGAPRRQLDALAPQSLPPRRQPKARGRRNRSPKSNTSCGIWNTMFRQAVISASTPGGVCSTSPPHSSRARCSYSVRTCCANAESPLSS